MAITIYGPAFSNYVRAVRMLCEEKGVPYELSLGGESNPLRFRKRVVPSLHPFKKIPIIDHGGFQLFETTAILNYVDRAFPGTSFTPKDAQARARMDQWMSATHAYFDRPIVRELLLPMAEARRSGEEFDFEARRSSLDAAAHALAVLNDVLDGGRYIAGDTVSLADLLMLPILNYTRSLPQAEGWLEEAPALRRWLEEMEARPAFVAATSSTVQQ